MIKFIAGDVKDRLRVSNFRNTQSCTTIELRLRQKPNTSASWCGHYELDPGGQSSNILIGGCFSISVAMLPTPPYDAYLRKPATHGSMPPMQTFNTAPPTHPYETARYDDYMDPRQYRVSSSTSVLPQPVYHPENKSYGISMTADHSQRPTYGMARAPVLPPIQVPDRSLTDRQQVKGNTVLNPKQQVPREEKVGGVAAHLDYKMDEMVDFVSEMSQGMYEIFRSKICLADIDMIRSVMNSKVVVHPEFRRYVSQVLTSTRLPSSTILLGLHYLAVRMTILSSRGDYNYGGGDVYSLLTTALLLGSKFLDDNTFQNRSWSDVSNISVKKLNLYETEWLQDINWDMHFDVSDPKGFALWLRRWQAFQMAPASQNIDSLVDTLKETSIDESVKPQQTSFQHLSSNNRYGSHYSESGTLGHYADRSTQPWNPPCHDAWKYVRRSFEYSPPSLPETGPNTPEYMVSPNGFGYGTAPPAYPSLKMPAPLHVLPSNVPAHVYPTPLYEQYNAHNNYCACSYCMPYGQRSSMNLAYDQTVVG